jgi:alkylation response protein AidB-like acyl-CoA dehydrogenase
MGLAISRDADSKDEPPLCCYFERSDVLVHDTWRVSGLRGTGSCDFEVCDLFVPEHHTHVLMAPRPTQSGIVYRLPTVSVFPWTVSVVPLGIMRGAMNAFAELASGKARQGTGAPLRDREIVQSNYGRADALLRAARAFLIDAMSELMAASAEEGPRLIDAARCTGRLARMPPKVQCGSLICSPPKRELPRFSRPRRSSASSATFTPR